MLTRNVYFMNSVGEWLAYRRRRRRRLLRCAFIYNTTRLALKRPKRRSQAKRVTANIAKTSTVSGNPLTHRVLCPPGVGVRKTSTLYSENIVVVGARVYMRVFCSMFQFKIYHTIYTLHRREKGFVATCATLTTR